MNTERGESPILAGIYEEFERRAREKVMKEAKEKQREIFARRLLAKEMEIDEIMELTEVDEKRIIELQQDMEK